MKSSPKVEAMLARKVNARELCYKREPDLHDKLVLELATELHEAAPDHVVAVSWQAQEEAASYFRVHGFVDTLDHMLELRSKRT